MSTLVLVLLALGLGLGAGGYLHYRFGSTVVRVQRAVENAFAGVTKG